MNNKEKKLAADFLEMASNEFSNHGCNDVPDEFFEGWTLSEKQKIVKEYHISNNSIEDYDPNYLHLADFCLMDLLSEKLKGKMK
jgi:hypothetical protein